jgi:hypothetical protein
MGQEDEVVKQLFNYTTTFIDKTMPHLTEERANQSV